MKYSTFIIIFIAAYRIITYALYEWKNNNVLAFAGAIFMALLSIIVPVIVMLTIDKLSY
ncbi:MAG: hypothetical protein PWP31_747 [Clostridia bacterium]|nr:hypothetical protein [Clostridia bacterium]